MERPEDYNRWNVDALYRAEFVAEVAGIAPALLRKWLVRYRDDIKPWEPGNSLGEAPAGEGLPALFTFNGLLQIVATARLVAAGTPVLDAYWAAARWTHVGSSRGFWVGEPEPKFDRLPGELFPAPDLTVLLHHTGRTAKVIRVPRSSGATGAISLGIGELWPTLGDAQVPPKLLLLNDIHRHAKAACLRHMNK